MISENDAILMAMTIGSAMINDDKEAREAAYADLDTDELKRVLRWQTRNMLKFVILLSAHIDEDPMHVWQQYCLGYQFNTAEDLDD